MTRPGCEGPGVVRTSDRQGGPSLEFDYDWGGLSIARARCRSPHILGHGAPGPTRSELCLDVSV